MDYWADEKFQSLYNQGKHFNYSTMPKAYGAGEFQSLYNQGKHFNLWSLNLCRCGSVSIPL